MQEILKYLKDRGERLDSEIATDTGISLENVRLHVSALSARGEVMLPVDSIQQRQEERGLALPHRGLYSACRSRQEIQSAPESADSDVGRESRDRPAGARQRRPSYQEKQSCRLRSVRPRDTTVFTMNRKNSRQP